MKRRLMSYGSSEMLETEIQVHAVIYWTLDGTSDRKKIQDKILKWDVSQGKQTVGGDNAGVTSGGGHYASGKAEYELTLLTKNIGNAKVVVKYSTWTVSNGTVSEKQATLSRNQTTFYDFIQANSLNIINVNTAISSVS